MIGSELETALFHVAARLLRAVVYDILSEAERSFSLRLPALLAPLLGRHHQAQQSSHAHSQDKQLWLLERRLSPNRCGQSTARLDDRRKSTLRCFQLLLPVQVPA